MLDLKVEEMASLIRRKEISSVELIKAHIAQIERIQPHLNPVVALLSERALQDSAKIDARLRAGEDCGPLAGVPFSIKDSIALAGEPCTAGTLGRKSAAPETEDATLVRRLRQAGAIPLARTNLPDLLFSFETDNLVFGQTSNPYDITRSCGGSSGGEAALIAACGSPLGLGSDAFGSVRLPSAFCGIAGIKPTSGRLPRSGHVPPPGIWIEKLWQIGPMARWTDDLVLAMRLLSGPDGQDISTPPVPLFENDEERPLRIGFFTDNGFARVHPAVKNAVTACARFLSDSGAEVKESRPPNLEQAYELEMAIVGADGAEGIDTYLKDIGSPSVHPFLTNFVDRMRPYRGTAAELAGRWTKWDRYRSDMLRFFAAYDAVLSPVYTQTALPHGASMLDSNFEGFSYTMAWNVAGYPAATVRCAEDSGLPINVQVIASPWQDMTALKVCALLEKQFGGWQAAAPFVTPQQLPW